MSERSKVKKITQEARILRHLRIEAGLTLREVGHKMNCSDVTISHREHGRMGLPLTRIESMVEVYGSSMTTFNEYLSGERKLPINYRDECKALIDLIDDGKVQAVYGLLMTFLPDGSAR